MLLLQHAVTDVILCLSTLSNLKPIIPKIAARAINLFANNVAAIELEDTTLAVEAAIGAHINPSPPSVLI